MTSSMQLHATPSLNLREHLVSDLFMSGSCYWRSCIGWSICAGSGPERLSQTELAHTPLVQQETLTKSVATLEAIVSLLRRGGVTSLRRPSTSRRHVQCTGVSMSPVIAPSNPGRIQRTPWLTNVSTCVFVGSLSCAMSLLYCTDLLSCRASCCTKVSLFRSLPQL